MPDESICQTLEIDLYQLVWHIDNLPVSLKNFDYITNSKNKSLMDVVHIDF